MPENALAPKGQPSPMALLSKQLEGRQENIAGALAKRMPVAVWMLAAKACYNKIPGLFECTQDSQFHAWNNAALMGQIPGIDVHWIPFKNNKRGGVKEVVCVTDYKNIVKTAMDSGMVDDLYGRVVYKDDVFEVIEGTSPQIIHKPNLASPHRTNADIVAVYMVGHMKGHGKPHTDVMTKAEVDAIRARSRAGTDGPWVTDYPQMAIKTVIKRGTKTMPRNIFPVEFLQALQHEDEVEFDNVKEADYSVLEPGRRKLGQKKAEPAPEPEPEAPAAEPEPKAAPRTAESMKAELKTLLAKLNPEQSADLLFAVGIDSLNECRDPKKLEAALVEAEKADVLFKK